MHILILGGGGFIGLRLAREILRNGGFPEHVQRLTLVDFTFPEAMLQDPRLNVVEGDFSEETVIRDVLQEKPDVIYHLAAVVSGEAEKNFELGMKVNFHASLQLLELCRTMGSRPRIVFASSCAVFGGDVSKPVTDDTRPEPRSSYGTQKAMVELLINDYSRRRFIDGRSLRLPTITVRPGKPNAATSSFLSGIIREPLHGIKASYPVAPETEFWLLSPRRVIEDFIHAATLEESRVEDNRVINLPGITASVQEMIDGLGRVTHAEVTQLISCEPDAFLQSIVLTWPPRYDTRRARELGFEGDASVEEIIRYYIEEEGIQL